MCCTGKGGLWSPGAIGPDKKEMKARDPDGVLMRRGYCTKPLLCWSWHCCCFQITACFGEESEHIACEHACSRGPALVPASLSLFMWCRLSVGNLLGWRKRRPCTWCSDVRGHGSTQPQVLVFYVAC